MKHDELLDLILWGYLYGEKLRLEGDLRHNKLLFKTIARVHDPNIDEWNIEFLKKRLFDDGFLKKSEFGDDEPFELTAAGVKAAQQKYYTSTKTAYEKEIQIKDLTIKSLKDSRRALIISVLAFIVPTITSIYSLWTNREMASQNEVNNLKKEIVKLQLENINKQKKK